PNLQGSPLFTRDDGTSAINFALSNTWPSPGFQHDSFSVRWTRQICFPGQPYIFTVTVDDGARFYIDTTLIIDAWKLQPSTTYTKVVNLTQGCHLLRLEYFQDHLQAQILLTWNPPNGQNPPYYPGGGGITPSGTIATVNTYALNVRNGPGVNFDILTQITRGQSYPIIARNADTTWLEITGSDIGVGWVSAYYVTMSGNIAGLPVAAGPSGNGQATGVRGQALAVVRVRSGPGFGFGQIDTLDWQTIVDIVGRDSTGNWVQIRNGDEIGWVYSPYIVIVSGSIADVPITG
ncbi:MAG TPA: SH3 domain-containing protein, partial [Aggregatilineales bacterium]|nr:SH3 domain-containing protein [Aggregatilineales bacterium]